MKLILIQCMISLLESINDLDFDLCYTIFDGTLIYIITTMKLLMHLFTVLLPNFLLFVSYVYGVTLSRLSQ